MARQQILLAGKIEERKELYDLTYSGILMMLDIVSSSRKRDLTPEADSLNDFWANDPALFGNVRLGRGVFMLKYKYMDNITDRKAFRFGVVDEERKINVNYADKDILERLFAKTAGLDDIAASQLADSVIDWRDPDDVFGSGGYGSTETANYAESGYEYTPRNRCFSTLEELLLVDGMSSEIFLEVRDYITVFTNGRININTASIPVLASLGLSDSLAHKVVLFRSGPDMTEGTLDDNVFYSADISEVLTGHYDLSDIETDELLRLSARGVLDTRSGTFNAVCTGKLDRGRGCGKVMCVFEKDDRIKYWGYRMQEGSGCDIL